MCETCRVQTFDGTRHFNTHAKVVPPVTPLTFVNEPLLVVGACKPFAFFIPAFDTKHIVVLRAVLKEKLFPIGRGDQGSLSCRRESDHVCGPAINGFPEITASLVEDTFAKFSNDVLKPFKGVGVLPVLENLDDIGAIRRKIHVFHSAASRVLFGVILVGFTSSG